MTLALSIVYLVAGSGAARADDPGYDRPGIGFTPMVLGAGQFTWEQGLPDWTVDRADGSRSIQYSADTLLRMGLGGPFELQVGGSAYNRADNGGRVDSGRGDTSVGLKFAPTPGDRFGWGLLASVEATDGAPEFRSERRQYLLGAQFNLQLDSKNALGLYLEDVRGAASDRATLALGESLAIRTDLSLYAEAAWLRVPARGVGSLAGAGLAWQVSSRVQLDIGLDRGLEGAAPRWQGNLGVAVYFGR